MLQGATCGCCATSRCMMKHCRIPVSGECCLHWARNVTPTLQQPRFESSGLCYLEVSAGASLPWQEVWHHWLVEADDRAEWHSLPQHLLITASVNGDVVCSVLEIKKADTLNTHFTNWPYCKIVVTDVLKYFPEYNVYHELHCRL